MLCTPQTHQAVPAIDGLAITPLTEAAALADIQAYLAVQQQGFSSKPSDERPPISEAKAEDFRSILCHSVGFLGRLHGEPASTAMFSEPWDGLTEIMGIATIPAFRRRGIGSALTDQAVRTAFRQGAEIALLTAGDEAAGRLYQQIGFQVSATGLVYAA